MNCLLKKYFIKKLTVDFKICGSVTKGKTTPFADTWPNTGADPGGSRMAKKNCEQKFTLSILLKEGEVW